MSLLATPERLSSSQASQAGQSQSSIVRRLLFTKLGSFSHTNERILEQLHKRFPDYEIVVFEYLLNPH
jgi:hypothetical protein